MELKRFIGSRIKELRISRGMNQEKLADLLCTTKQTISRYENGERQANQDILFDLSNIFNVCIDDFFPERLTEENDTLNEYTYFPTAISAGLPLTVDGVTNAAKISISDEVLGKYANDKDIFFVRANGDSMNNLFTDGSLMAVKKINNTNDLFNGDITVYSNDGDYSVKHFYKYGDTLVFKPNSTTEHEEHEYNAKEDNIQIHGKVVTYIVNLD